MASGAYAGGACLIYILLSHEHPACDQCGSELFVYQFAHCFTQAEFDAFIEQGKLKYSVSQRKLWDQFGFERFEVRTKEI
jgi:hypothetical protein